MMSISRHRDRKVVHGKRSKEMRHSKRTFYEEEKVCCLEEAPRMYLTICFSYNVERLARFSG